MANLLRVEETKSHLTGEPDGWAWFVFDDGRSYHRKLDAREATNAAPMIISDKIDDVLSHADGKMYDSKSALFASYRPEGNPQGVRYECIGEHVAQPFKRPARDKELGRQAVTRALQEMGL